MDSNKVKTKTHKQTTTENARDEKTFLPQEPEQKKLGWELIFILIAFGIGTLLFIFKILGVI